MQSLINIERNKNENYEFSVNGTPLLCFNKRLVEIGIGGCFALSVIRSYNHQIRGDVWTGLSILLGLGSTLKIGEYSDSLFTLLHGVLVGSFLRDSTELNLLCSFIFPFHIGESILIAGGLCVIPIVLALLIKKYGSEFLKNKLENFNIQQNEFTLGAIDIKNNLQYQFSLLGRDVLCLNKHILRGVLIIGMLSAVISEFSYSASTHFLIACPSFILGALVSYRAFGNKYLVLLSMFLCGVTFEKSLPFNEFCQVFGLFLSIIGQGVILSSSFLGALALISYLVKKSGDKRFVNLKKFLDKLKDKEKEKEFEKNLQAQKREIEAQRKKAQKSLVNDAEESNAQKINLRNYFSLHKKGKTIIGKSEKSKNDEHQGNKPKLPISPKNKEPIDEQTTRTYICHLTGDHKATWDQLFEITKSQPDHLVIKGESAKNLIVAFGGRVEIQGKRHHIYFGGKNLGSFEVTHQSDKRGFLTSSYAQRIKDAIIKAIESQYIDINTVSLA